MIKYRPQLPMSLACFRARGFRLDRPAERAILEGHARSFLTGFNLAVRNWRDPHGRLHELPAEERGFAYEGAGMHAALRDLATGGRACALPRLLDGPGDAYVHLVHVGYGWALVPTRVPLPVPLPTTSLLRWLALDGAGFADVYLGGLGALHRSARSTRTGHRWAARLAGCGRALWFVESADVSGVAAAIAAVPPPARRHLWSGVGLACAYAGCADGQRLTALRRAAGPATEDFLQGAVFGVTARVRAGVVPAHTEQSAQVLLGFDPVEVAAWADTAAAGLAGRADVEAYTAWKARLRVVVAERTSVAGGG